MRVHRNAKTTPKMRQLIVDAVPAGLDVRADRGGASGMSVRTVAKWMARSRQATGCSTDRRGPIGNRVDWRRRSRPRS